MKLQQCPLGRRQLTNFKNRKLCDSTTYIQPLEDCCAVCTKNRLLHGPNCHAADNRAYHIALTHITSTRITLANIALTDVKFTNTCSIFITFLLITPLTLTWSLSTARQRISLSRVDYYKLTTFQNAGSPTSPHSHLYRTIAQDGGKRIKFRIRSRN